MNFSLQINLVYNTIYKNSSPAGPKRQENHNYAQNLIGYH